MKKIFACATLIFAVACAPTPTTAPATAPVATQAVAGPVAPSATGFTAALNAFRAQQGRGAVTQNAALTRAAQAHAEDMARRGYFSHQSPNGPNGNTFMDRARAGGCGLRNGAENIANGQRSEAEVLTGWQNSPGHRRNMLVRQYTQYGLGRSGNLWVLLLAESC